MPYCREGELYAPDGMITRVGSRYFRLCSDPVGAPGERRVRVTLNPDAVPGLSDDYVLVALKLDDRVSFSTWLESAKRGLEPAGIRMFGDSAYQAFDSGQYGPNGLPTMGTYVPVLLAAGGEGGPDHFITCIGEADFVPTKGAL